MIFSLPQRSVETRGNVYVAHNATVVGSVILEADSSVWFNAVIRADNDVIRVGERSNIQDGAVLHTDAGIELNIGRDVSVGHMVMLHGCSIGDGSLIGIKSIVMNHARIGRNCLIGANTLITEGKVIPDRSLVVGSPGKVIREVTDEEIAAMLWNAEHYVHKLRVYQTEMRQQP